MADLTYTDQNFEAEVLKSPTLAVVDFWAEWCMPCKIVSPIIEELAKDYAGKVKIGKLNVDENQDASSSYNIMSIPTVVIFKNGQPVNSVVGARSKQDYKKAIDEALAS